VVQQALASVWAGDGGERPLPGLSGGAGGHCAHGPVEYVYVNALGADFGCARHASTSFPTSIATIV